ncbi:hypothetical protein Tco_1182284 [Tanacetum coccineum]
MFNNVKLQVDYDSEMAYELLKLVKKQLKEGYGRIIGIKRLLSAVEVTVAVNAAEKVNAAGYKTPWCIKGGHRVLDLPLKTTNPPTPRLSFDSIERLANEPPPLLDMDPPLPPLPPQLLTFPPNPPLNFPPW